VPAEPSIEDGVRGTDGAEYVADPVLLGGAHSTDLVWINRGHGCDSIGRFAANVRFRETRPAGRRDQPGLARHSFSDRARSRRVPSSVSVVLLGHLVADDLDHRPKLLGHHHRSVIGAAPIDAAG
jgi:hypothetical protein